MAKTQQVSVAELARQALTSSPIRALRELRVESLDGGLLISGTVTTFYHKQMAQEVVRAVISDVDVVNSIEVR